MGHPVQGLPQRALNLISEELDKSWWLYVVAICTIQVSTTSFAPHPLTNEVFFEEYKSRFSCFVLTAEPGKWVHRILRGSKIA